MAKKAKKNQTREQRVAQLMSTLYHYLMYKGVTITDCATALKTSRINLHRLLKGTRLPSERLELNIRFYLKLLKEGPINKRVEEEIKCLENVNVSTWLSLEGKSCPIPERVLACETQKPTTD